MPLGDQAADRIYLGYEPTTVFDFLLRREQSTLSQKNLESLTNSLNELLFDYVVLPLDVRDKSCLKFLRQRYSDLDNLSCLKDLKDDVLKKQNLFRDWIEHYVSSSGSNIVNGTKGNFLPVTGSDLSLPSGKWSWLIVFCMSPWLLLDDPTLSIEAQKFCQLAFEQQLAWASHCTVYSVLLPSPVIGLDHNGRLRWKSSQYAATISRYIETYLATRLWIRIPLIVKAKPSGAAEEEYLEGWHAWCELRAATELNAHLGVALELTQNHPIDLTTLDRWIAEPLQAVIIPHSVFVKNLQGVTVLPKVYKQFLRKVMRHQVQIIIQTSASEIFFNSTASLLLQNYETSTMDRHTQHSMNSARELMACIVRIHSTLPKRTEAEDFELPCLDRLQSPLQPLRDNLESTTYETFEKDPVKYKRYEDAILACLEDRINAGKKFHNIMVVGAGRGPLVAATLRALQSAHITKGNYYVTAVEKNQNAIITLRSRVTYDPDPAWRDVEVVDTDMRAYAPKTKADLIISELLGSFGDNELSPECLDGAQSFLADDGVFIPYYYFSSLEPISTPKLWIDCKGTGTERSGIVKALETLHVVKLHAAFYLSKEGAQKCFEFHHPRKEPILPLNAHNSRCTSFRFTAKVDTTCHGFACYFHCNLYKDITISIHPPTYSEGMISWFPIYMPLKHPIFLNANQTFECHVWRRSDGHQVWYEWVTATPYLQCIHNVNGRSHAMLMLQIFTSVFLCTQRNDAFHRLFVNNFKKPTFE